MIELKLQPLLQSVSALQEENKQMANKMNELQKQLKNANDKVEKLEAHNRLDNLIIYGVPVANYSEAALVGAQSVENCHTTEETVLGLINKLNVPLTASGISIAHRLAKTSGDRGPPRIIVRFVNRKARDAVYAARRQLRSHTEGNDRGTYINEDLTSQSAELFRNARNMVKTKHYIGAGLQVGLSL